MSLENAQYIHQLLPSNPTTQDYVKFGDDHLRMLKQVLLNTFPAIQGVVQVSHTTLNNLPANTNNQLQSLYAGRLPKGAIIMWDIVNQGLIPAGYSLCDGSVVAGYGTVPDMRNLFIQGWGDEPGGTEAPGAASTSLADNHTHPVDGTVLTTAQMPPHTHLVGHRDGTYGGGSNAVQSVGAYPGTTGSFVTSSAGEGEPHTHTEQPAGAHSHGVSLPHYRAVFIVKVTDFTL